MSLGDHFKKFAWYIITPIFPFIRDLSKLLGMNWYEKRQPYHLGWLARGRSVQEFRVYLESKGFDTDKIAWVDDGEVLELRLKENFRYQYHVRLFNDGEIRGHYELTPEYDPIGHLKDSETTERKDQFLKLLGDWVTETPNLDSGKTKSQTTPATSVGSPYKG